jgi:coenzyme PQQ precursor peptide PqqA
MSTIHHHRDPVAVIVRSALLIHWATCQRGEPSPFSELRRQSGALQPKEKSMAWKTPKIVELGCGMEINAYFSAKV